MSVCEGAVTVRPLNSALCYVNGKMITDETALNTGSRVIFGKSHVFRFTNPQQGNYAVKFHFRFDYYTLNVLFNRSCFVK